jgi:hypothetical protein
MKTKTYMILEIGTDTKMWLVKTSYWDANPLLVESALITLSPLMGRKPPFRVLME